MESLPGSWFPFGDLVSILESGVQNIAGTSPNMKVVQVIPWDSASENKVQGADIVSSWDVVEQVLGVLQDHWPQLGRHSLWPSQLGMKHLGSCKVEDHTNFPFSNSILVVSTHPTEGHSLFHLGELILELCSSEDSIVSVVVEDSDSHRGELSLKSSFGSDGLTSSEVDHWFHMNIACCMILEDHSTFEHSGGGLTPSGTEEASRG